MRYALYDYHASAALSGSADEQMVDWWSKHWEGKSEGRSGFTRDLTTELVWPTIEDVIRKPGRLLEAGCGPGQWVQFLEGRGHSVTGLDYAESGLLIGQRQNPRLKFLRGDLRGMPFADGTFDYILSIGAVEHDVSGPDAALREFRRVLAPTGALMCSVPCLNVERRLMLPFMAARDWLKCQPVVRKLAGKRQPFEFYEYLFTPDEYTAILRRAGLEVVSLRPYSVSTRSAAGRAVAAGLKRFSRFYNPHMMMAICRRA